VIGRGGDNNGIEGRLSGPAVIAVRCLDADVAVARFLQGPRCLVGELRDDFDAVDFGHDFGQDRRLIAGTGADLQNSIVVVEVQRFCHEGHHVGLGDGLPPTDGQGRVLVGL